MQPSGKKARRAGWPTATGLVLLALLAACEKTPPPGASPPQADAAAEPSCGDGGRLSARLYGSITREIGWSSAEFECESMLRPNGKGIRLRMVGSAADSRLALILALPELERGSTAVETPTVVTLTVEGSGRFFSTPTLDACWSDIASQEPVAAGSERYAISGILFCVAPLGEINGDAAISIPELEFSGVVDWGAT